MKFIQAEKEKKTSDDRLSECVIWHWSKRIFAWTADGFMLHYIERVRSRSRWVSGVKLGLSTKLEFYVWV